MAKHLTDAQFREATAQGLTVVDFWAPWCGPCQMQLPVIEQLSEELSGQVEFFKMNVDEEDQVARQFGVMSIPMLLIQKDGEPVEKLVGFHDKVRLTEILKRYM